MAARDYLVSLQTGEDSLMVIAARDAVQQAQAGIEQAQAVVLEAEAQLALLDLQMDKLTLTAPVDGVVLTRSIQPGEVIQAGMTAMTIAKLDTLTVTVYISEDRYGEVKLGDTASLSVDSFPGETFTARRNPHRRPGRVHPAQRADQGRAPDDSVCGRTLGGKPGWEAQTRDAGGCDI